MCQTKAQDEANQEPDIDQWIDKHGYVTAETCILHDKSVSKGKQDAALTIFNGGGYEPR